MSAYAVQIKVMPHANLLDPQGKAVLGGLHNLGLAGAVDVRVGKHISLTVEAANEAEAKQMAEKACTSLLANQVMESWEVESVSAA
jgi:phosphoribosylformylglycinamidine synthase